VADKAMNRFSIFIWARLEPSSATVPGNCETSPLLLGYPASANQHVPATSSSMASEPMAARTLA